MSVAIVSIRTQETGEGGETVFDLKDKIERDCQRTETKIRLNEIIGRTLGSDFCKAVNYGFDTALAEDTLRIYSQRDIPTIAEADIPREISELTFCCDLENVKPLKGDEAIFRESALIGRLRQDQPL